MRSGPVFGFGPFRFAPGSRQLTRGREPVVLSDRQVEVLHALVSQPGHVVSKDALIEVAWKDVAVGDNSLEQVISSLRRALGPTSDGTPYIETLARRGYRFSVPVSRSVDRHTDEVLEALLAPHRGFVEGRASLETLGAAGVARARAAFAGIVAASPEYASGHVGLANALALEFEATRAGDAPNVGALVAAVQHAREACRLEAESGEAWATLAFVLSRIGADTDALAAGRRAIALEPDNWQHHLRLAYASWGGERLRAADKAARLLPGLALAHWLAATVHVARQAFDEAERQLATGAAAQDSEQVGGRFRGLGLHLLLGLVRLARGDESRAEQEFGQELGADPGDHIYARQAVSNAWCARGALCLRQQRRSDAAQAFGRALECLPGHPLALAALSVSADDQRDAARAAVDRRLEALVAHGALVEVAMTHAVVDVHEGRHDQAAGRVLEALQAIPVTSSVGWTVPVEPLLNVTASPGAWTAVLAALRNRAA